MDITLTPEQSHLWDQGNWIAYAVEQDITEPVTVILDDGSVAFGITPPGRSEDHADPNTRPDSSCSPLCVC
jgi:hypothetical protein